MTHPLHAPPVPAPLRALLAADDVSTTIDLLHAYGQVRLGPEDARRLAQLLEGEETFGFPADPEDEDGTWVTFMPGGDGTLRILAHLEGGTGGEGVTLDFADTRVFLAYLNALSGLPDEPGPARHPALVRLLEARALRSAAPPNIPFR